MWRSSPSPLCLRAKLSAARRSTLLLAILEITLALVLAGICCAIRPNPVFKIFLSGNRISFHQLDVRMKENAISVSGTKRKSQADLVLAGRVYSNLVLR